jgi:hypothetical protein
MWQIDIQAATRHLPKPPESVHPATHRASHKESARHIHIHSSCTKKHDIRLPLLQHICSVPIAQAHLSSLPVIPHDSSRLLVLSNQLLNSRNVLLLRIRGAQVLDLSPLVVLGLAL